MTTRVVLPETVATTTREREREQRQDPEGFALRALFGATQGSKWSTNEGWPPVFGSGLLLMKGVTLSKSSHVTRLNIQFNNLNGRQFCMNVVANKLTNHLKCVQVAFRRRSVFSLE